MENVIFTIVTPCYNCEKYIENLILSLLSQTFTSFEHIIVDGGSNDSTVDIIKNYVGKYNMRYISEKDNGMYDAINKGFAMGRGQLYAWINADDMYFPWTLEEVYAVMKSEDVKWCTGREAYIDMHNRFFYHSRTVGARAVAQSWIKKGYMDNRVLGFVMQECTFWTKELWEKAGGVDNKYLLAGDYMLWKKFAEYEPLYTVNTILAAFRKSDTQLTSNMDRYYAELPSMGVIHSILAKTKLLFLYNVIFRPNNKKYLLQVEDFFD